MTYQFSGVTFKTELTIGLVSGLFFIAIWVLSVIVYYYINQLDSILRVPNSVFFGAMSLGMVACFISLRLLGKKYKQLWTIYLTKDQLNITDKGQIITINISSELRSIILVGTNEMRYLKIYSNKKNYKIRIGISKLVPFSDYDDLKCIDLFINNLDSILQSFEFSVKKVNTKNGMLEYRFINKELLS